MDTILKRNDNTSIYCPEFSHHHHRVHRKVKVAKILTASSLMFVGAYMVIFFF